MGHGQRSEPSETRGQTGSGVSRRRAARSGLPEAGWQRRAGRSGLAEAGWQRRGFRHVGGLHTEGGEVECPFSTSPTFRLPPSDSRRRGALPARKPCRFVMWFTIAIWREMARDKPMPRAGTSHRPRPLQVWHPSSNSWSLDASIPERVAAGTTLFWPRPSDQPTARDARSKDEDARTASPAHAEAA